MLHIVKDIFLLVKEMLVNLEQIRVHRLQNNANVYKEVCFIIEINDSVLFLYQNYTLFNVLIIVYHIGSKRFVEVVYMGCNLLFRK